MGVAAVVAAIASLGQCASRARDPLVELGRFDGPKYEPPVLQGPENASRKAFDAAMGRYVQGDYRGAISGLRQAIELDPAANHARFYLGLCLLLTGDAKGGVSELEGLLVVGPAPYLEDALFYLAKGHLQTGDVKKAREVLELLIAFDRKHQTQAKELLSRLPA